MALRDGTNAKVARTVTSCRGCLAWGMTYSQDVCLACYNFAARYKVAAVCGACGDRQLLKRGYCRLCWCQASLERPTGPNTPLAPYVGKVRCNQLFLADMNRRHAPPRAFPVRRGAKGRPLKAPPPPTVGPCASWFQPPLFDAVFSRHYRYGRIDLRRGPAPDNPWLAWALHLAHSMAETRGFDPVVRRALNRTLVMLLVDHASGEVIRRSDFQAVVTKRGTSMAHTTDVLTAMGVLVDDRPPTFEHWLRTKLVGVAPGIASETERWSRTLKDGGSRTRARDQTTVQAYLLAVRPALLEWSARHGHLREITSEELVTQANALHGKQRQMRVVAFRSLFAWAKRNGVVFANPAVRLSAGRLDYPVWQPLLPEEITRTVEAATTPQARLFVVLAAVHAARTGAVRAMQLDDVDLANRRLTIAGRTRPLDDLTCRVLVDWLDHRRRRWPHTANPHLLVSRESALKLGPVSEPWGNLVLRGLPATLERLRIDRQLEEALTHGADPLHLAIVFDISESTAIRYAASARQLLERPHEANPVASP